jgi:thymidylate synthase
MGNDINRVWMEMVYDIIASGSDVAPRGNPTREILGHHSVVDMKRPVLTLLERKMGYKFMCASAAWILSGDNRVSTIKPYSKMVEKFSDDGKIFFGAYGPKIKEQLAYVTTCLRSDRESRQAVINIWRENPPKVKDVPCTLNHQFFIRDNRLNVVTHMRSNDVWLGFPYDVFDTSMLAGYILLCLGDPSIELGLLYHSAGSRHLYESNRKTADHVLRHPSGHAFTYESFDPYTFSGPDALIQHLWALAEHDYEKITGTFLVKALINDAPQTQA